MNLSFAAPNWFMRRLKPMVLVGLILVAYLAAINRGQTLVWGIAALLLATLLTGISWPRWLLARLAIERHGPERAEEGETVQFVVTLTNHGWLPRFMIEVVDRLPFSGFAQGTHAPRDQVLGVVTYLGGRRQERFFVPVLCEKRGRYQLGPVGMISSFPLGLSEARRQRGGGLHELTIYPDLFPILGLPLMGTPSQIHRGGLLLPEGAGAAEFSGLREYRRGDNPRHIHWPSTARTNRLQVKEFEPLASACLTIALDLASSSNIGIGREATFEYAVRVAASIARYASEQAMPVRLIGAGEAAPRLGPGLGEAHHREILDALAVADANTNIPYAVTLNECSPLLRRGETLVALLSGPPEEAEDTINAISLLRSRGANVLAICFDRASFRDPSASFNGDITWLPLLDLGVEVLHVRRGDDLVRLFNT